MTFGLPKLGQGRFRVVHTLQGNSGFAIKPVRGIYSRKCWSSGAHGCCHRNMSLASQGGHVRPALHRSPH